MSRSFDSFEQGLFTTNVEGQLPQTVGDRVTAVNILVSFQTSAQPRNETINTRMYIGKTIVYMHILWPALVHSILKIIQAIHTRWHCYFALKPHLSVSESVLKWIIIMATAMVQDKASLYDNGGHCCTVLGPHWYTSCSHTTLLLPWVSSCESEASDWTPSKRWQSMKGTATSERMTTMTMEPYPHHHHHY